MNDDEFEWDRVSDIGYRILDIGSVGVIDIILRGRGEWGVKNGQMWRYPYIISDYQIWKEE